MPFGRSATGFRLCGHVLLLQTIQVTVRPVTSEMENEKGGMWSGFRNGTAGIDVIPPIRATRRCREASGCPRRSRLGHGRDPAGIPSRGLARGCAIEWSRSNFEFPPVPGVPLPEGMDWRGGACREYAGYCRCKSPFRNLPKMHYVTPARLRTSLAIDSPNTMHAHASSRDPMRRQGGEEPGIPAGRGTRGRDVGDGRNS
jgi:hypothetical protein